jgi:hypothetical protein
MADEPIDNEDRHVIQAADSYYISYVPDTSKEEDLKRLTEIVLTHFQVDFHGPGPTDVLDGKKYIEVRENPNFRGVFEMQGINGASITLLQDYKNRDTTAVRLHRGGSGFDTFHVQDSDGTFAYTFKYTPKE